MKPENLKLLKEADSIIKSLYAVIIILGFINLFIVIKGGTPKFNIDLANIFIPLGMLAIVHSRILKVLKSEKN